MAHSCGRLPIVVKNEVRMGWVEMAAGVEGHAEVGYGCHGARSVDHYALASEEFHCERICSGRMP